MAQYKVPPDPRVSKEKKRSEKEPVPWLWLGLGVIVTLIGLGLAISIARAFLLRDPLVALPPEPTVIILTAPPSPTSPSADSVISVPTAMPTFTPVPTPDVSVAPDVITPGYYAQVVNTDNVGVTIRGGPNASNARLTIAPEGTILLVLDGPQEGSDFLWWQVRLDDGTEGWAAGDFLAPAAAP